MIYDCIVIGGGPAGMMATISASKLGAKVLLLEKNEKLGKKLYITGKGRCNVTNSSSSDNYFSNIVTNQKFLYSVLNNFDCHNTINFFESNNCPLQIERGNRVFPTSNKSNDIIKTLEKIIVSQNVKVALNKKVLKISKNEEIFAIKTTNGDYQSKNVVVATGGLSYPATGSTGDGYNFAKSFGHNVVASKPALCDIKTGQNISSLEGLHLKNVIVTARINNKIIKSEFGELLIRDNKLSGPTILTISSYINKLDDKPITISVNLKPGVSDEELERRLLNDIKSTPNITFKQLLKEYLPNQLIDYFINYTNVLSSQLLNSITTQQRRTIIQSLQNLLFNDTKLDKIDNAIITSGGIDINNINPKTMESKITQGMYFAGELIDVDALTGGYNIQIALSTGYTAGISIANKINKEN